MLQHTSNTVVDWKFPSELYGAAKALSVGFIVKPVGEPDAGNPHVRFDERGGKRDDVRVATAPNPDSTENKGPAFSSPEGSANVIENKGSYALNAGILLKTQVVSLWHGSTDLPLTPTTSPRASSARGRSLR
jgi:hypothetical protein